MQEVNILYWLLSARTATRSIQWIWLSGKMIMIHRINAYQCESMRITINTLIFIYLCHIALDHWRGKTLFFMWFLMILVDSHWFSMIFNDSHQFSNKCEIDSWWSLMIDSHWFSLILSDSWFSPVLDDSWISLELILVDSQISLNTDSHWFSMILGDSHWFSPILNDSWISLELILIDSWRNLNPDSHWFSMILK